MIDVKEIPKEYRDRVSIEQKIINHIQNKLISDLYYDKKKDIYIYKPFLDDYNTRFPDTDALTRIILSLFKSSLYLYKDFSDTENGLFIVKRKEKPFLYLKFGKVKLSYKFDKNSNPDDIEKLGNYTIDVNIEVIVMDLNKKILSSGYVKLFELPIMIGSKMDNIMYKKIKFGNIFYVNGKYRAISSLLVKLPSKYIVYKKDYLNNVIVDYKEFRLKSVWNNYQYQLSFLFYSNVKNMFLIHNVKYNYDFSIEVKIANRKYKFPLLLIYFVLGGTPEKLYKYITEILGDNSKILLSLLSLFEEYQELKEVYGTYENMLREVIKSVMGEKIVDRYETMFNRNIVDIFLNDWFLGLVDNKIDLIEFIIRKLMYYAEYGKEDDDKSFEFYKLLTPSDIIYHTIIYSIRIYISNLITKIEHVIKKKEKEMKSIEQKIKKKFENEEITKNIYRTINIYNVSKMIFEKVQLQINRLFINGKFSSIYGRYDGVSQIVDITNKISVYSSILKVVHFAKILEKADEYRSVYGSEYGKLCPIDTPEGQNVGLNRTMSIFTKVSKYRDVHAISLYVDYLVDKSNSSDYVILLNGSVVGRGDISVYKRILELKEEKWLYYDISVSINHNLKTIEIYTTDGRIYRYVFKIKDGELVLSKVYREIGNKIFSLSIEEMLDYGIIDLISYDEENISYIIFYDDIVKSYYDKKYLEKVLEAKYCEIADYSFLALTSLIIPFSNHNSAPRNTMGVKQTKQALSKMNNDLFINDVFKKNYRLVYSQYPLTNTITDRLLKEKYGINVVVAILSNGYNMQDAIMINKASVERGLFLSEFTDTIKISNPMNLEDCDNKNISDCLKDYGLEEYVKEIDENINLNNFDENGIIKVGEKIKRGDKIAYYPSYTYIEREDGYFDTGDFKYDRILVPKFVEYFGEEAKIMNTNYIIEKLRYSIKRKKSVKENRIIRLYDLRFPEVGDKLSTRHGQKGVISILVPQEDMPFTESGIIPDLIVNPHSIPSRMTIGQLLEIISGKIASLKGKYNKGDVFYSISEEEIRSELANLGFHYSGREYMYDGITGRKYEAMIFTGVIYYMRLKHFVKDKIQYRSIGANNLLTGEPIKGKKFGGGLRLGEMELWTFLGHGVSNIIQDRMFDNQKKVKIVVCGRCGEIINKKDKNGKYICYHCGNSNEDEFYNLEITKQLMLMINEVKSMGISIRFNLKTKEIEIN